MLRDVKTVSSQASAGRESPLALVDPYSQQMIVYAKPGNATASPDASTAPVDAAGGVSKALRLLQFALLASVAVMIWYLLRLLQTAE